jgi:hypothetical protein
MRFSLRQLVLALVLVGIAGLEIELALLRHAGSLTQWIPHICLLLGLVVTAAVYVKARRPVLRAFQWIMVVYLVVGAVGVYLHYRGNVEFALERDPSLSGLRLFWKALRGATPALAPGALAQLGLLGLLYTYGHPSLTMSDSDGSKRIDY